LVDSMVVLPPPPPPPPPVDQAGNPLQMLILILMMLAKEKLPMATDPTKPGQGIDLIQVLVPLLLQSIQSGKQIDISQLLAQLLSMLLTGKPLAAPAAVPMTVAPPPPATQQPTDLNALLLPLLMQVLSGKPLQGVTLPNPSVSGAATSETSSNVIQKPSVQLSMLGLALSSILQAVGTVGTPFGFGTAPSMAGTLATLVPILTGAFGATGGFGSLLRLFKK